MSEGFANPHRDPAAVPPPADVARAFHHALPGYAPTPLRALPRIAAGLGLDAVTVKDESSRLGLPAFKVLGASWAVECALRDHPGTTTLVAASAGNHGRAVAHVARSRGLRARIVLPARATAARRAAIEAEGAELVVVDGGYEAAVATAAAEGARPGALEIADVGTSKPALDVVDGYATLFDEFPGPDAYDLLVVPAGVGSLAAAAVRYGTAAGVAVVAVEPTTAACVTASLRAGEPVTIPTPGTTMAGLDCAEVSLGVWPQLRAGLHGTVTVDDEETHNAMRALAAVRLAIGDCGAAPLAALPAALTLAPDARRVVLVATEGVTDPEGYAKRVSPSR